MHNCRKFRSMFAEEIYGEMTATEHEQLSNHFKICSKCSYQFAQMTSTIKAMDKRTRHEPQADYWDSYWDNLVFKLQTEKATKRQFSNWLEKLKLFFRIEPRLVFQLAGATALILLGVLIGKFYFQRSTPLEFQATVREQPIILSPQEKAAQVRANRYLARSKVLLLALINFEPENEDPYGLNLPLQQSISRDLVNEAPVLKSELKTPANEELRRLIADLEIILLQIANLESHYDVSGIDIVKNGINRTGILFKINVDEIQRIHQNQTGAGNIM